MEIYFLRHGLAGQRTAWQGDDAERQLTEEGKERMAREAVTLDALGIRPDVILTSPLARAYQTAEIVARQLGSLQTLRPDEHLAPGFGLTQLDKILKAHPEARSIMLVGHEPDFSSTIGQLIGGGDVICKKGGIACVELTDPATLRGSLVWLLPPRVLAP
jgi:phosphohistidine phosphatase